MKYTILEIFPGRIRVEFEDNSWAFVPIKPNSTLDEIDYAVSQFDPDFLKQPESITNLDISVGDQRESKKLELKHQPQRISQNIIDNNSPPQNIFDPVNILLSDYFHQQGDSRLKDLLNSKLLEYISSSQISPDSVISNITESGEIFSLAESELNKNE